VTQDGSKNFLVEGIIEGLQIPSSVAVLPRHSFPLRQRQIASMSRNNSAHELQDVRIFA
jgi:hypothetical protein